MESDINLIENDNLLRVNKIISIEYTNLSEEIEFNEKKNPFWRLILIEKGEAFIKINNKNYSLKQNSLFILSPNKSFCVYKKESVSCRIFIISFKTDSSAINNLTNERIILNKKYEYLLPLIFKEVKNAYKMEINTDLTEFKLKNKAFIGAYQVIRIYIQQMLIIVFNLKYIKSDIKISSLNPLLKSELITSVYEILKCNVRQNLTNKDICDKINYSYSIINNIFKKNCGYSIHEYFLLLKIEEAKKLLRESAYTVTQISDELHFNSPQYFSRVFKKITGMYPKEYPNKIKLDSIIRN